MGLPALSPFAASLLPLVLVLLHTVQSQKGEICAGGKGNGKEKVSEETQEGFQHQESPYCPVQDLS
jgi:hypothetical protein